MFSLNQSKFFHTSTFKQSFITTGSTVVNGALGAVFYLLLARILFPADYGSFSTVVASVTLLSSVFDWGTNQGLVKFLRRSSSSSDRAYIITLSLGVKLISGLALSLLFAAAAPLIAIHLFHHPELTDGLRFVGLGVLASVLFSFTHSLAQALDKFWLWGGLFITTNLFRLGCLVVLWLIGQTSSQAAIAIYTLVPLLGFFLGLFILRPRLSFRVSPRLTADFFQFNKWVTASIIVSAVGSRIDTLLTARLLDLSLVGIYSLSTQMIFILPQISTALGAVAAPKFSSFTTASQNLTYVKKALLLSTALALAVSLGLVPVALLIIRFVGAGYQASFTPFLILLLAMVVFLSTTPIRDSIMYYYSRPNFFFYQGLVLIFLTITFSLLLIPTLKVLGSSLVILFSQVTLAALNTGFFFWISKHHDQT